MITKNICPVHHFRYAGNRCPICEKERINAMVKRYTQKEEPIVEEKTSEYENLDWNDLSEKFKIGTL
jgi:hypothetical protein